MDRYDRHRGLFGEEAFRRIRRCRVLVAGAGGLGSTVLQLLARGGFGTIFVYDDAIVDLPDLNRQLLYGMSHLGMPKVEAARAVLSSINPDLTVVACQELITAATKIPEVDIAIDCLDNFAGRFALDELFFARGVPLIHGGVSEGFGQVTTFLPGKTQGLRELFGNGGPPDEPELKRQIYPPVVTAVASLLASEAFKLATGRFGELLAGKMLILDVLANSFDLLDLAAPAVESGRKSTRN